MVQSRQLTYTEIADFLSRHPVVATQVAATKAALLVIGYDQLQTPPAWYEVDINIGLIGPSGIEVEDATYGNVVIQPAPDGEIYFTGWANVRPSVINQPPYESPTSTGSDCDWLCQVGKIADTAAVIGMLILAGYLYKSFKKS